MKKINELVKYQLHIYFKGSKFVMPLVVTAIFLFVMYSSDARPVGVVTSCLITCNWVFLLMVWIGLSVSSDESPVMEQIIFLRVKSNVYYYLSKMLFLIILGFIVNSICLLYPIIINLLNNGTVFERPLTNFDILNCLILLCGSSVAGCSLGSFFHSRVMKDRKMAIVLTVLFATVTIVKIPIINSFPLIKIVTWILPPLDMVSRIYGSVKIFQVENSVKLFFILFVYAILVFIVKSLICYRRKF